MYGALVPFFKSKFNYATKLLRLSLFTFAVGVEYKMKQDDLPLPF